LPLANPIAVAATSDNLGKAVLDLLAAHRIIADDSLVARITAGWDSAVPGRRRAGDGRAGDGDGQRRGIRVGPTLRTAVVSCWG
jgi:hypothetical protein